MPPPLPARGSECKKGGIAPDPLGTAPTLASLGALNAKRNDKPRTCTRNYPIYLVHIRSAWRMCSGKLRIGLCALNEQQPSPSHRPPWPSPLFRPLDSIQPAPLWRPSPPPPWGRPPPSPARWPERKKGGTYLYAIRLVWL